MTTTQQEDMDTSVRKSVDTDKTSVDCPDCKSEVQRFADDVCRQIDVGLSVVDNLPDRLKDENYTNGFKATYGHLKSEIQKLAKDWK